MKGGKEEIAREQSGGTEVRMQRTRTFRRLASQGDSMEHFRTIVERNTLVGRWAEWTPADLAEEHWLDIGELVIDMQPPHALAKVRRPH